MCAGLSENFDEKRPKLLSGVSTTFCAMQTATNDQALFMGVRREAPVRTSISEMFQSTNRIMVPNKNVESFVDRLKELRVL